MYGDDHNPPHFHVNYGGTWSVIDFDGNIIGYLGEDGLIHDPNGNIIGKYEYNAYGQIKSIIQNNDTYDINIMIHHHTA